MRETETAKPDDEHPVTFADRQLEADDHHWFVRWHVAVLAGIALVAVTVFVAWAVFAYNNRDARADETEAERVRMFQRLYSERTSEAAAPATSTTTTVPPTAQQAWVDDWLQQSAAAHLSLDDADLAVKAWCAPDGNRHDCASAIADFSGVQIELTELLHAWAQRHRTELRSCDSWLQTFQPDRQAWARARSEAHRLAAAIRDTPDAPTFARRSAHRQATSPSGDWLDEVVRLFAVAGRSGEFSAEVAERCFGEAAVETAATLTLSCAVFDTAEGCHS